MRLSGPSKRRRDTPARIPPLWTRPGASTAPLWRYPPLGSPFFVPAPFLSPAAVSGEGAPSTSTGNPGPPKKDAKIVQFEWNGCTFYRYIPDGSKMGSSRMFPTDAFGRSRGFDLGWDRGRRPGTRSQSRRRKQMQQNGPVPRPPWGGAGIVDEKQPPYRGPSTFRPRDNPRIPRKENKLPASHMHLPPFLTGTPTKTVSSTSTTKSPSPVAASTSSGPTRTTPPAFQTRTRDTVLPFAARAFGMSDNEFSSPGLPKRETKKPTALTKKLQEVPESDALGAKPKKPSRPPPSTPKADRTNGTAFGTKTFNRAAPFRNSPRVYSSTVLKDFNTGSRLDSIEKSIPTVVMTAPKSPPAPKEQRRPEKRVRYRAEIVGSNIIVTRADSEASSPEKPDAVSAERTADQTAEKAGGYQWPSVNSSEDKATESMMDVDKLFPKDVRAGIVKENMDNDEVFAGVRRDKLKDAFTQLAGSFHEDEGDRVITVILSDERFTSESTSHEGTPLFSSTESEDFMEDGRSSRSVQTDLPVSTSPDSPDSEAEVSRSDVSKSEEAYRDLDAEKEIPEAPTKVQEPSADLAGHEHKEMMAADGISFSHTSFSEEPPTNSSEMYLDSFVSSPRDEECRRSNDVQQDTATTACCTKLLLDDLDVFLKDCSPIKSPNTEQHDSETHSIPCGKYDQAPGGISIEEGEIVATVESEIPANTLQDDHAEKISINSDVILINFAEDTSTLKEHLDSLVADYKSKLIAESSDSEDDGDNGNILERHAGSSPTESCAPVLKPADVSPAKSEGYGVTETCNAICAGDSETLTKIEEVLESPPFPERGDGNIVNGSDNSQSFCSTCTDLNTSHRSDGTPRMSQTSDSLGGDLLTTCSPQEANEEKDRDVIPCFVEESVEYVLESEEEEYEVKRRTKSETSQHGEDRMRYPENSNSWQNADRKHRVTRIPVVASEKEGSAAALIYDCPWWTYAQDDSVKERRELDDQEPEKQLAAIPWSILDSEEVSKQEESSTDENLWSGFLAKPGELPESSSGDPIQDDTQSMRSDADFSTLYMEGQSKAPQGTTESLQNSTLYDRDSISFYEFGGEQQDEGVRRVSQSISMETLISTSRLNPDGDAGKSISPLESDRQGGGGEPMPEAAEECAHGDSADSKEPEEEPPSGSQYCELDLSSPVRKSGQALCAVVAPAPPGVDGDPGGAEGVDAEAVGAVSCEDVITSCEKKNVDKPMGKIRTRFRDFFWKHK